MISEISGQCLCGSLSWSSKEPIIWSAICHCFDCRRAASSDFVSWIGLSKPSTTWLGRREFYQSSKNVRRSFCASCGAPASFETTVFPDEVHVYAAMLNDPNLYKPTAHIFWSERVPWVILQDDLPKHEKGLQHAAQNGKHLL